MEVINFDERPSLMSQFVRELRDINIQGDMLRFRRNLERIGEIMAYEISKTLSYDKVDISTPLENMQCDKISDQVVLATIFRAGVPFHKGLLNYFDHVGNAFVSAYRKYKDNEHFDVHIEYIASPRLDGKTLIIADPILATGASMELSYKALLTKGEPSHIHIVSIIASQVAVDYVKSVFPADKTTVWAAAIDSIINSHGYIIPGLGDAGDLAYGPKE